MSSSAPAFAGRVLAQRQPYLRLAAWPGPCWPQPSSWPWARRTPISCSQVGRQLRLVFWWCSSSRTRAANTATPMAELEAEERQGRFERGRKGRGVNARSSQASLTLPIRSGRPALHSRRPMRGGGLGEVTQNRGEDMQVERNKHHLTPRYAWAVALGRLCEPDAPCVFAQDIGNQHGFDSCGLGHDERQPGHHGFLRGDRFRPVGRFMGNFE